MKKGALGEYICRIELLEHLPNLPESAAYLEFLAESGVGVVASNLRWVYLRKKAVDGVFDLYSDKASRLAHYKRILQLLGVLAIPISAYLKRYLSLKKGSKISE